MQEFSTVYVGLDVHKDSIDIALAEGPRQAEVRHLGTVAGGVEAVSKAMSKLVSAGRVLHIVYEAGPCGFVLQRHFTALGWHCDVVAPSSIPRAPGERIKTDRRDAIRLARLARSGDLSVVRVPGAADEAVRDLVRAREDSVREQRNARHRLKALLLRNNIAYAGKSSWTAAHLRWLATLKLEHAAQQVGFQEYLHSITESGARISRLEQALRDTLPQWSLTALVQALQALRGVQLIAAMTLVAELQDFLRFDNPRQLMAYVGLVPGEDSSGPRRRQGSITKAGNSAARRMLVEVAWHYQHAARVSPIIAARQDQLPKAITDIAWAAHLCDQAGERSIHRETADHCKANARHPQGVATNAEPPQARADPCDRQVAAERGSGLLQLPCRTWQRPTSERLPKGCCSGLDACYSTAWSAWSNALGPVPADRRALPSPRSGTSSVPERAPSRQDLRQEPYAVVPHVRICAGGGE